MCERPFTLRFENRISLSFLGALSANTAECVEPRDNAGAVHTVSPTSLPSIPEPEAPADDVTPGVESSSGVRQAAKVVVGDASTSTAATNTEHDERGKVR